MISKTYSQSGTTCQVTFELPDSLAQQSAFLCAEFNEWSENSHPLKQRADGRFALTVDLQPGANYRFRYLLDGHRWENDEATDAYVPNPFGSDDSVVKV